jgi:hydroxymethylpyrimidine/phosphomethylpyrimidine kinase
MRKSLTIAGFDPSGGAGIQADLKVFRSLGVYGLSVASALTAQNTSGVRQSVPVDHRFMRKQLTVLLEDLEPDATKTGMLYSEAAVTVVVSIIKKYSLKNIVIDPVLLSSTGKRLITRNAQEALRKKLLPLCTVILPNMHEASVLTGIRIATKTDMEKAARQLKEDGADHVIITGGHLESIALDVLYNGDFHYFRSKKIRHEFHGTGCTFSAAVTAFLAKGYSVLESARLAKRFMSRAFKRSFRAGGSLRLFDL